MEYYLESYSTMKSIVSVQAAIGKKVNPLQYNCSTTYWHVTEIERGRDICTPTFLECINHFSKNIKIRPLNTFTKCIACYNMLALQYL